jgi:predicted transcriptional regulator of viral defense system
LLSVTTNHAKKLLKLSREHGILRPRDLQPAGIPRAYLKQLVDRGELLKAGRGLYVRADAPLTENQSLAETAKLVPNGVICLLSALRFHGLTTENPGEIWIAIPRGARAPRSGVPALRVMWFSGRMLTEGAEKHRIQGVPVLVYSVAKTVADCFRFRHRIGVNIALEALRGAWGNNKATSDQLWHCAKVCRVLNVMRPYFDSLA